jgi:hypothetical protein
MLKPRVICAREYEMRKAELVNTMKTLHFRAL